MKYGRWHILVDFDWHNDKIIGDYHHCFFFLNFISPKIDQHQKIQNISALFIAKSQFWIHPPIKYNLEKKETKMKNMSLVLEQYGFSFIDVISYI